MRELKRKMIGDTLSDRLPLKVTNFGETIAIILSLAQYNRLVKQVKGKALQAVRQTTEKHNQPVSQSSIPLYNPLIHRSGDTVLIRQGKRLVRAVVPELDGDGKVIPLV